MYPALRSIPSVLTIAVIASAAGLYANPVAPMILSEIQFTDQYHWSIEFLMSETNYYAHGDTFTDQYGLKGQSYWPNIPVTSAGIAVISSSLYPPGVHTFKPGDTVTIYTKSGAAYASVKTDSTLKPNQSYCAFKMYYTTGLATSGIFWGKDNVPTIGAANDLRGACGVVQGRVYDAQEQPAFVKISWGGGYYRFGPFDVISKSPYGDYSFTSMLSSFKPTFTFDVSQKSYGPYAIEPQCTVAVDFHLDDYEPTPVKTEPARRDVSPLRILSIHRARGVEIVFNGGATGDFDCAIFSASGKRAFSSTVRNRGSGTYGFAWDKAAPGGYVARVSSGGRIAQRLFTVQ
jgi:hypothetical protein